MTGAASGIGREVARILATKGWRVYACDVNTAGLEEGLGQFPNVVKVTLDVASEESCKKLVQEVSANGASLDALINVAGIVMQAPATAFDEKQVQKIFDINTIGPMRLIRDFVPVMLRSDRGGWIVNVTSIGGKVAWPWSGVYSPTKAALNLFSDGVRREAVACGLPLRVTIIAPGPVYTPMVHKFTENLVGYAKTHPDDPFSIGIGAEGKFQQDLEKRGWGVDMVSVTATDVANQCVNAVEMFNPPAYVFVARLPFRLLAFGALYLPTYLGDRLLAST